MDLRLTDALALSSGAEADARKAPGRDTQGDMELSGVGARAGGAASSQTEGLAGSIVPLWSQPSTTQLADPGGRHI